MIIPITNLIIYGTCPECGDYLVNIMDDFSASYGALNIGCKRCGYMAIDTESKIRELISKHGLTGLNFGRKKL